MVFITFPDAAKWQGVYEADTYRGSSVSAEKFGVERSRLLDDNNRLVHRYNGREIPIGQVFVRRHHQYDGETNAFDGQPGSWQLIPDDVYRNGAIVATSREIERAAGEPMVDPLGTVIIVDDDGNGVGEGRPNRPDVGEQARDKWTGALLFDENGAPVLVTE